MSHEILQGGECSRSSGGTSARCGEQDSCWGVTKEVRIDSGLDLRDSGRNEGK